MLCYWNYIEVQLCYSEGAGSPLRYLGYGVWPKGQRHDLNILFECRWNSLIHPYKNLTKHDARCELNWSRLKSTPENLENDRRTELPTAMASIIPVPRSLDISPDNRSFNWDLFKQSWTNYELATGLNEKPDNVRVATLLSIIGYDALQAYNAFVWQPAEEKTIDAVLEKFEIFCQPRRNVSYERFIFMNRKQKNNECIDDYLVALRNQSKRCNYESLTDSLIRDALILGVKSKATQECLLRENDPSLNRCIDIVKAAEQAKQHVQVMSSEPKGEQPNDEVEDMEIDKVTRSSNSNIRCKFCGKHHRYGRLHCAAYGKDCTKCGKKNHFSSVCYMKREVNLVNRKGTESEDYLS